MAPPPLSPPLSLDEKLFSLRLTAGEPVGVESADVTLSFDAILRRMNEPDFFGEDDGDEEESSDWSLSTNRSFDRTLLNAGDEAKRSSLLLLSIALPPPPPRGVTGSVCNRGDEPSPRLMGSDAARDLRRVSLKENTPWSLPFSIR